MQLSNVDAVTIQLPDEDVKPVFLILKHTNRGLVHIENPDKYVEEKRERMEKY